MIKERSPWDRARLARRSREKQISVDEEDYLVPIYMKQNPASATMLVARGQSRKVKGAYGVSGIPANFVIDKSGIVRNNGFGYGPGLENRLREWIDAALGTARK